MLEAALVEILNLPKHLSQVEICAFLVSFWGNKLSKMKTSDDFRAEITSQQKIQQDCLVITLCTFLLKMKYCSLKDYLAAIWSCVKEIFHI